MLTYQPKEHGCHVAPCLVLDAQEDLDNEEDSKERGEEGISTKRGNVSEVCEGQVASV